MEKNRFKVITTRYTKEDETFVDEHCLYVGTDETTWELLIDTPSITMEQIKDIILNLQKVTVLKVNEGQVEFERIDVEVGENGEGSY